jgi:hypothetical protein
MKAMEQQTVFLSPRNLYETQDGNLAHAVGRLLFLPGGPMLVEHVGGVYLPHDLYGRVLLPGHAGYEVVYARRESFQAPSCVAVLPLSKRA